MAGAIKRMADKIIEKRAKGNETLALLTVAKITLKGVRVEKYDAASPDDPIVINKLKRIAAELGVTL
ncbi:MAG: hypothetical protein KAI47_12915 [Deltaproteobacteria bacterium]|nr:hypothetical protein [Deltaproteobacteria bacterium]